MPDLPLALLLLRASRWFDRRVLDRLRDEGWPPLSPAQSLVFAYLDEAGTTPAELARRLGHSRQATQQLLDGLVALDLLASRPNPARRGGLLVALTDRGRALAGDARRIFRTLEADLGPDRSNQLRSLLAAFEQPDPAAVRLEPAEPQQLREDARGATREPADVPQLPQTSPGRSPRAAGACPGPEPAR